jgi:hypothetical protein
VLETGKIELEMRWLCSAKVSSVWVHRTVRWCTGQCPVCQAGSGELAALGNKLTAYDYCWNHASSQKVLQEEIASAEAVCT